MPKVILDFQVGDWLYFSQLLEKGYSFEMSLQLMNKEEPKVIESLQQGWRAEQVVLDSCKGRFAVLIAFFIEITSLATALKSAISLYQFERSMKHKLFRQTAYPLFIFLFSFVTVFIFSSYIIPQLIQNFEVDTKPLFWVVTLIRYVSIGTMCGFAAVLLLFTLCKLCKPLYSRLGQLGVLRFHIAREFLSYYLSSYLLTLNNCGLSTKQAFCFLRKLEKQPLLFLLVEAIYKQLESGDELALSIQHNAMLSKNFKLHYAFGVASNSFDDALTTYRDLQEKRWDRQLKRLSIVMQVISYSFVGVLMICVYQIMLIPLEMLERM